MSGLIKNKYFAAGFVFLVFQWIAYSTYIGEELTDSERRRSKANALDSLIGWFTGNFGTVPSAIFFSLLGVVLGYVAYRRVVKMSES
ncbi:MAG: hypothetical protein V7661_05090 [Sulfitobacter sp.]|jgi:hypothetical protein